MKLPDQDRAAVSAAARYFLKMGEKFGRAPYACQRRRAALLRSKDRRQSGRSPAPGSDPGAATTLLSDAADSRLRARYSRKVTQGS